MVVLEYVFLADETLEKELLGEGVFEEKFADFLSDRGLRVTKVKNKTGGARVFLFHRENRVEDRLISALENTSASKQEWTGIGGRLR